MSTLILSIGAPPKRPRKPIQNSQRKALRAWYYDDSNQAYGYHLNSYIGSEIIGVKWARLNNEAIWEAANLTFSWSEFQPNAQNSWK